MTWILKDQRVVSGIDSGTGLVSYNDLKAFMQWFVGTYLVSRGYETFIDDSESNNSYWYYGVRKNWTNKFGVNITTSYVSCFQRASNRILLYLWDLGSNDPTVGLSTTVHTDTNTSLLDWIKEKRGPQTMQVWESDTDSSSWIWRRLEPAFTTSTANFFGIHYPDNCFTQQKDYGDDTHKYFANDLGLDTSILLNPINNDTFYKIAGVQYAGAIKGLLTDRWAQTGYERILESADVNGDIFYYTSLSTITGDFGGRINYSNSGNYKIGAKYYFSMADPDTTGTLVFDTGSIDPSDPLPS